MSDPRPFHRLFGLTWFDFFQGTSVEVEPELDLSLKQQYIDVVLIHKGREPIPRRLPDGFEDLATFNLVTFKSFQEALDAWALWELIGHFVNYRKQSSPSLDELLPEKDYRLFAVAARYPQKLEQRIALTAVQQGVYDVDGLGLRIRIIVAGQLPLAEHNAMLHLFSAREELLRYGREHYRPQSSESSSLLYDLFKTYEEDPDMANKLQEFYRETLDKIVASMPPEELLKKFSPEQRLKGLPAEERLKGLPAEERLKGLTVDEVVRGLPPEVLEALARKPKSNGA